MKIKNAKNSLTALVIASTLFSTVASGFQNLGTAQDGSDSNAVTPVTGYNFIASNVTFTIDNGDNIGTTGNVSIDNNNGFPGSPFNNDTIQFLGTSTVAGDIGPSNPIPRLTIMNTTGGAQTVTLQGSIVNATDVLFVEDAGLVSTLSFDQAGLVFTGQVSTADASYGAIDINQDTTINGDLGLFSTGNPLSLIRLDADLTHNGDVFADSITFAADQTLTLTGDHIIRAPITALVAGKGHIIIGNMTTFTEDIGTGLLLAEFTLSDPTSHAIIQGDVLKATDTNVNNGILEVQSDLTQDGNLNVNAGTVLFLRPGSSIDAGIGGVFGLFLNANSTYRLDMGGDFNATGVIEGTPFVDPTVVVDIVNPAYSIIPQQTAIVIDSINAGANLPATLTVNENSFLSNFTVTKVANELRLNIRSTPVSAFATQTNTQGLAEILDLISMNGASGSLLGLIQQLGYFTNLDDLLLGLQTLAPIVDGALMQQSFENMQNAFGYITERMDRLQFWRNHLNRGHLGGGGFSSGDVPYEGWYSKWDAGEKGLWLKLWRQHANQQGIDDIPGYKSNTWSLGGGFDSTMDETLLVGGALNYAFSEVHHRISDGAETKINSLQGTLYGSLDCIKPWFYNAQVGLAYNHYNIKRSIDFGTLFLRPEGETNGWQLGLNTEAGYVMEKGNFHFIPSASMFYSHLWLDGYEEGNVGTAGQSFESAQYDTWVFGFGASFNQDYVYRLKLLQPAVHAYLYYDVINDRFETNSAFVGFGPNFTTRGIGGDPWLVQLGASFTVYTLKNTVFELNYDFGYNTHYKTNTGFIKWRVSLP